MYTGNISVMPYKASQWPARKRQNVFKIQGIL